MSKVLIVEDEAIIANELAKSLGAMGYEVVGIAASGKDAILRARSLRPDVILMDIALPGELDGIDAAETIRVELHIPVVFLTAGSGDCVLERAKRVEPFGYIVKPFQEEQVKASIEVAIYRNQMERRLRESEQRYRRIVNTAQEGIYVVDVDVKINFVNQQMAEMLGYTVEEMHGRYLIDFIDDLAPVEMYKNLQSNEQKTEAPHDFRFRRKDGSVLWGMISSSPILDEDEKFMGALGMVIDVSERKRAELALKKTNEELKNFVDVVAHDLRNPILSVQGFSVLLRKKYEEKLGDKGGMYVHQIEDSARQMDRLVSDLLSLSSIGETPADLKYVKSSEIVKNVVTSLKDRLQQNGIELVIGDDLPVVFCDAKRIYQVFENLLANAIKYMGDTENPKIQIGHEDDGEHHRFYLMDNGIGIDPKHHVKIFEMFQRTDESGNAEGTGLGLSIVEKIVSSHGGRIWVESEKGKGATFYFTLPRAD